MKQILVPSTPKTKSRKAKESEKRSRHDALVAKQQVLKTALANEPQGRVAHHELHLGATHEMQNEVQEVHTGWKDACGQVVWHHVAQSNIMLEMLSTLWSIVV
jgi:hypothetical protein